MTDPTADLLPEGLADRLPAAASRATRAMRHMLDAMDAHGYDRVRPPLIEFEKSMATRMDGVQPRRMFRFVDPVSLRTLALRSDITVQVGRIAATSLAAAPRPLRLCYAGEVAVIRADQLDPARQRLQIGAELIGSNNVNAAAEIVSLAIESALAAGAEDISVDFTLPDLVDTLAAEAFPLAPEQTAEVRRELDAKDAGGLKAAGGESYLPLLYATGPFDQAISQLAQLPAKGALDSRIDRLCQIASQINSQARITLDPTERHGFEYQSWFGFTLYAGNVRGALGRGGTYAIRGAEEVATGFSLYIDALVDRQENGEAGRDTLFLPLGHDRSVAGRLRAIGWRTIAAIDSTDTPSTSGCTHILDGKDTVKI
ncbi:MAG: ATP phosphoribosyltransferase regulatory subunit [Sphingomonadaceae bacterium]